MEIYIACDHAGFYLKEKVKEMLTERGFVVNDFGATNFQEDDNFADYVLPCVQKYIQKTNGNPKKGLAIIFGGSGTGEAIVANKVHGARSVVYNGNSMEIVKLGRAHNNANVLSVGARFVEEKDCYEAIKIFMSTPFDGGRHTKRVLSMDML